MSEQVTQPVQEELNPWEEKGFLKELASICSGLETLEERHFIPESLRQVMDRVMNATRVEEFNDMTVEDIHTYIDQIRNDLPRYYNEITGAIRDIGRARAIVVDDDYI